MKSVACIKLDNLHNMHSSCNMKQSGSFFQQSAINVRMATALAVLFKVVVHSFHNKKL
jgi:hypothetical protein